MIKILHLYYDLLNLYGENANLRALKNSLEKQGQKVKIDFISIDDKANILDYDFIYFGSGSDEEINLAKKDILKYKKDLIKYINDKKFMLVTGNGLDILEGILDYKVKKLDFRIVGEQVYTFNEFKELVIGFNNRDSVIYESNEEALFKVKNGTGRDINVLDEGIKKNNFYGTYLLGPILVRNPYLLKHITKKLLESKKLKYKNVKKDVSYVAYEEFLKNFVYNK